MIFTCPDKTEDDDLSNRDQPKGFPEIIWVLHLGNKTGKCDLANEGIADIKEGIHARNEGCSRSRNEKHQWIAAHPHTLRVDVVWVGIESGRMLLDAREHSRENDADEGKKGGQSGQLRERVECPGQGADERDQRSDGCKAYSADCMRAHGV
jgi:hypothetical protein